ncbi:MAG: SAV_6107 family HEPN domain-containing protein [Thermoleophilia bacterium]
MSLKRLLNSGKLRRQKSSPEEIANLLALVDRDLKDASLKGLSPDRRFATAYNAVLQLATIALRVNGYRTAGLGHHSTTFKALPSLMGKELKERADYFDACRAKRNTTDYGRVGDVSESEAKELFREAKQFKKEVTIWMANEGLLDQL